MVIWLIGLSGAGKYHWRAALFEDEKPFDLTPCFIDGDKIREVKGERILGHSLKDRKKTRIVFVVLPLP